MAGDDQNADTITISKAQWGIILAAVTVFLGTGVAAIKSFDDRLDSELAGSEVTKLWRENMERRLEMMEQSSGHNRPDKWGKTDALEQKTQIMDWAEQRFHVLRNRMDDLEEWRKQHDKFGWERTLEFSKKQADLERRLDRCEEHCDHNR